MVSNFDNVNKFYWKPVGFIALSGYKLSDYRHWVVVKPSKLIYWL